MICTARRAGALALSWTLAFTLTAQSSGLRLSLAKPLAGPSPRELVLRVADARGRPAAGATITVRLPGSASSASGLRTEILSASSDGSASIAGIRWSGTPGPASISVIATHSGERADLSIPVQVAPSAPERLESSPRHSKTWLWIALVAGGAAGGAAAFLGGSSSTPASPAAIRPVITPPAVGTPTFTISKP